MLAFFTSGRVDDTMLFDTVMGTPCWRHRAGDTVLATPCWRHRVEQRRRAPHVVVAVSGSLPPLQQWNLRLSSMQAPLASTERRQSMHWAG
jgi:hypothetical protein